MTMMLVYTIQQLLSIMQNYKGGSMKQEYNEHKDYDWKNYYKDYKYWGCEEELINLEKEYEYYLKNHKDMLE